MLPFLTLVLSSCCIVVCVRFRMQKVTKVTLLRSFFMCNLLYTSAFR